MIEYAMEILRDVRKGKVPYRVFLQIHHCFQAIEMVGDMTIFNVKAIKGEFQHAYYRLRKGRYRASFYFDHRRIKVIALEYRSEVYQLWA